MPFRRPIVRPRPAGPPAAADASPTPRGRLASIAGPLAGRAALAAALCVALHALASGYALVARVRVEVVPASGAPAASAPAVCGTAVVRG